MKLNKIYAGDCNAILNKKINASEIDLIFADPPYNISSSSKINLKNNKTGGAFYKVDEDWDRFTDDEYVFRFILKTVV